MIAKPFVHPFPVLGAVFGVVEGDRIFASPYGVDVVLSDVSLKVP